MLDRKPGATLTPQRETVAGDEKAVVRTVAVDDCDDRLVLGGVTNCNLKLAALWARGESPIQILVRGVRWRGRETTRLKMQERYLAQWNLHKPAWAAAQIHAYSDSSGR